MPAGASWQSGDRLQRRLLYLSESMRAGSPERKALEADTEKIVKKGVTEALLAGRDENGREFTRLAPSTLKARRARGVSGTTPFITKGEASKIITAFRTAWETSGAQRILRSWWDVDWMKYHWEGGPNLPRRKPGIPPAVIEKVRARTREYVQALRKKLAS